MEVVAVRPLRVTVDGDDGDLGGDVGSEQAHQVQRDDRDQRGDHPGAHQVGHGAHSHGFQRVDFFADAHGTELSGEARAHFRGERDAGDDGRQFPGVDQRSEQSRHRGQPEQVQTPVTFQADLRAGHKGHGEHHADRSAAGQQ